MDEYTFGTMVRKHLAQSNVADVVAEIPANSGVFHLANVSPRDFIPTWISPNSGRFSDEGEKVRYYANNFDVCAREIGYPPGVDPSKVVYVAAETSKAIKVVDIHKMPQAIQDELFADKSLETKWKKSHVFMDIVREDKRFSGVEGAYYPSASGKALATGGTCLALFREPIATNLIGSGDHNWWKSRNPGEFG